jgi:hypothetical protein
MRYQSGEGVTALLALPEACKRITADTIREAARQDLRKDNFVKVVLVPEKPATADGAGR